MKRAVAAFAIALVLATHASSIASSTGGTPEIVAVDCSRLLAVDSDGRFYTTRGAGSGDGSSWRMLTPTVSSRPVTLIASHGCDGTSEWTLATATGDVYAIGGVPGGTPQEWTIQVAFQANIFGAVATNASTWSQLKQRVR